MKEDFVDSSYISGLFMESSFPVGESFAVQFGDNFRSRDHFQAGIICRPVQSFGKLKEALFERYSRKPTLIAVTF